METTTLVALGIPGLVGALALAAPSVLNRLAAAREKNAAAALSVANAKKLEAEAKKLEAEAARAREETTGRFARVAEAGFQAARDDLSDCEKVRDELRSSLATEREEREALGARCDERERQAAEQLRVLKGRVDELERRSLRPTGGA